VRYYKIQRF